MFKSNGSTAVKVIYSRGENKRIIEISPSFHLFDYLVICYIDYNIKKTCSNPIQVFFNPTNPFKLSPAANVQHFALFSTPGGRIWLLRDKVCNFQKEARFFPLFGLTSQNITLEEERIFRRKNSFKLLHCKQVALAASACLIPKEARRPESARWRITDNILCNPKASQV